VGKSQKFEDAETGTGGKGKIQQWLPYPKMVKTGPMKSWTGRIETVAGSTKQ